MNQYAAYFALEGKIKSLGFDPDRHELVGQFTNGGKDGLSQLSHVEYLEFLRWLKDRFRLENPPPNPLPGRGSARASDREVRDRTTLDKKRKRVIANMCQAGYVLPSGKPDMMAIEKWVLQQKHKKPFNVLTSRELSELIVAAEGVKRHFIKATRRR